MTSTMKPAERNGTQDQTLIGRTTTAVTAVGGQVHTAAEAVAKHVPAATAASRNALDRAVASLRGSSTGSLALGTACAAGVTGGMVLSRAPRALVTLASVTTLLLGGTVLGRGSGRLQEPPRGART
jgi:hypothetical protein